MTILRLSGSVACIGTGKVKLEKVYGAVALNWAGDMELELGWWKIIVGDTAERDSFSFDFSELKERN